MQWYFISLLFPEILFRHALVAMIVSVFSFRDAVRKNAAKDNRRQLCHSSLRRIQRIIHSLTKHFFYIQQKSTEVAQRERPAHALPRTQPHTHTSVRRKEPENLHLRKPGRGVEALAARNLRTALLRALGCDRRNFRSELPVTAAHWTPSDRQLRMRRATIPSRIRCQLKGPV